MSARAPKERQQRRKLPIVAGVLFVALLTFPTLASLRLARAWDARLVFGYLAVISGLTFWLYWRDKRRAEADGWRTPESTLHLAELLGGWPAAFLAQRAFRHKISKASYQFAFWGIVAIHEAVSFDFVFGWHCAQAAMRLFHL